MTHPLVTAFVITCNRKESLARALRSLLASDYPELELLVVDNGSTDGTVETLANDFPQVRVIRNDTNLGTCVAHNQGVKAAQGTYVIRVDDDVALAPDCLSTLVNVMEQDETIGLSGPKLYLGPSNTLWCAGGAIDWRNLDTVTLGEGEADRAQYDTMREVDYIGCCMFVRRSVYDAIGLIDEVPRIFGIQSTGSAAIANAYAAGTEEITAVEADTLADSISVNLPSDGLRALRAATQTDGAYIAVPDETILDAIAALGSVGIFSEPAAATAYAGLVRAVEDGLIEPDDPVVVLNTGSGLKDVKAAKQAGGEAPVIAPTLEAVKAL